MADDTIPLHPAREPEIIAIVGGAVDELALCLAIYGDDLDPDDVSRRLGCAPTSSHRKGERPPRPSDLRFAQLSPSPPYRTGAWLLDVRGEAPMTADELVDALLGRFPSDPSFWEPLHRDLRVELRFAVHTSGWNRGFGLSAASVARCAATGAPLLFDLYMYDDDGDDPG